MIDPLRESWPYVLFSWNTIIVAVVVSTIAGRSRAAVPPARSSA